MNNQPNLSPNPKLDNRAGDKEENYVIENDAEEELKQAKGQETISNGDQVPDPIEVVDNDSSSSEQLAVEEDVDMEQEKNEEAIDEGKEEQDMQIDQEQKQDEDDVPEPEPIQDDQSSPVT